MMDRKWLLLALAITIGLAIWRMEDVVTTIKLALRENYGGVRSKRIDAVILHTTEGTLRSAISWFQDPRAKVSAHYVIGQDGSVTQMVPDDHIAYHAGDGAVNGRSIGIEMAGYAAKASTFTPQMMEAVINLCKSLSAKYGIPVQRGIPGFAAHSDIPSAAARGKVDPGVYFPWDRFLDGVGGKRIA